LLRLAADRSVERVVGIDARDSAVMPAKLDFHRADIGTAELKSLLHGVDALAHLAFLIAPQRDRKLMARINVEGTRRVLEAAGPERDRRCSSCTPTTSPPRSTSRSPSGSTASTTSRPTGGSRVKRRAPSPAVAGCRCRSA